MINFWLIRQRAFSIHVSPPGNQKRQKNTENFEIEACEDEPDLTLSQSDIALSNLRQGLATEKRYNTHKISDCKLPDAGQVTTTPYGGITQGVPKLSNF